MTTVKINDTHYDLDALGRDDLINLKLDVDSAISKIRIDIDEAKARAAATGEYADTEWFYSARRALGTFGNISQKIQAQLKKGKPSGRVTVPDMFMDICRERLHSEIFEEYLRDAKLRYEDAAPPPPSPSTSAQNEPPRDGVGG